MKIYVNEADQVTLAGLVMLWRSGEVLGPEGSSGAWDAFSLVRCRGLFNENFETSLGGDGRKEIDLRVSLRSSQWVRVGR